jgi:serine O-acetyltransferase
MLYFKGYQAVQVHRIAHELWLGERDGGEKNGKNTRGEKDIGRGAAQEKKSGVRASRVMARMLQSRVSEVFAVDIHPAATLGRGLLLDHGTGVVIGVREFLEKVF